MMSSSIRAWNIQNNRFPSIFLYQNTPTGIFNFSNIDTEITEKTGPIETIALKLVDNFQKITRIEMSALTGISLEICQETIDKLHSQNLFELVEYDQDILKKNIDSLLKVLGDEWYTPHIQKLGQRSYLKQYQITKKGQQALDKNEKTIRISTNLSIIITGKPFYLFYHDFDLRHESYEILDMNKSLVTNVLQHAERFASETGTKPLALGSNSVIDGKEVSNSQFWISIFSNSNGSLAKAKYSMYLSSQAFDRWANPPWTKTLETYLPEEDSLEDVVVKAMSHSYDMVEDVIREGLLLTEDKTTWKLEADLEMQKLIEVVTPQTIAETISEVSIGYPNADWKIVILLSLEPYDELSDLSLKASRLHANVPRAGFTVEEGYELWQRICKEWNKPVNRDEYNSIITELVDYECLIERLPQVKNVIIYADDILKENRRGKQNWSFARLKSVKDLLEFAEVEEFRFFSSNDVYTKVDDQDTLEQWVEEGILCVLDSDSNNGDVSGEILKIARNEKSHYIGRSMIKQKNKQDREYGRTLQFELVQNNVKIPKLEPFYDWRHENILEKMYATYYE